MQKHPSGKIWLDKYLKSRASEDPERDNKENESKNFSNLNDSTFTIFNNHCEGSSIRKSLLLVIHEILRLLVNTLTVDDKDYLVNRDNLTQPIQRKLSKKNKKIFLILFCVFKIYIQF